MKYNWKGDGPGGCDDHNINHPCGKCMFPNIYTAAPEMLEALEAIMENWRNQDTFIVKSVELAIRAIQKARGES